VEVGIKKSERSGRLFTVSQRERSVEATLRSCVPSSVGANPCKGGAEGVDAIRARAYGPKGTDLVCPMDHFPGPRGGRLGWAVVVGVMILGRVRNPSMRIVTDGGTRLAGDVAGRTGLDTVSVGAGPHQGKPATRGSNSCDPKTTARDSTATSHARAILRLASQIDDESSEPPHTPGPPTTRFPLPKAHAGTPTSRPTDGASDELRHSWAILSEQRSQGIFGAKPRTRSDPRKPNAGRSAKTQRPWHLANPPPPENGQTVMNRTPPT
jgi:hypothetical protein